LASLAFSPQPPFIAFMLCLFLAAANIRRIRALNVPGATDAQCDDMRLTAKV